MTEAKIKTEQIVTPVTYEPISKAVWNARGGLVCKVDEHDANFDTDESIGREQWDELCDEVGFHIANALNRQSELEKRVVHLETVLTATKPLIDAEPQIDDLLNRSGKLLSEVKIKKLEAEAHESAIRTAAAALVENIESDRISYCTCNHFESEHEKGICENCDCLAFEKTPACSLYEPINDTKDEPPRAKKVTAEDVRRIGGLNYRKGIFEKSGGLFD